METFLWVICVVFTCYYTPLTLCNNAHAIVDVNVFGLCEPGIQNHDRPLRIMAWFIGDCRLDETTEALFPVCILYVCVLFVFLTSTVEVLLH